jgi:drug/metabolite transporter (DMT)-like permease
MPNPSDPPRWKADLALLGVVGIWGFNIPIMKLGLREVHPFAFNAARLSLSVVVLGLLARFSKPLVALLSPTRLAFLFNLIALPWHIVLAVPHAGPLVTGEVSAGAWLSISFSGVFSTGVAYALWNLGVRQIGPSHAAVWTNLVPVIALCTSWIWLQEQVDPLQLAGGAAIVGGLVVMRRGRVPR